jgi:anti-sigma B factor antagonist
MSQDAPQSLHVKSTGGVAVVGFATPYLQSEEAVEKVGAELLKLVEEQGYTKLILTFNGVRFVSSSMLAQVVKLHKTLTKVKGKLRICSLNPAMRDVLRASQLDRLLDVYEDEPSALNKF